MCYAGGRSVNPQFASDKELAAMAKRLPAQQWNNMSKNPAAVVMNPTAEIARREDLRAQNDAIAKQREQEMARVAEQQRQAEAQQRDLDQAQARQREVAQQQAAEQQRQIQAQREAQAAQIAEQQRQQQEEIARQRAEQEKQLAAQRLAAGAVSTSQRVLAQKAVGRAPTAPITVDATESGAKRRRTTAASENLRIGSSGRAQGAGLNIGG